MCIQTFSHPTIITIPAENSNAYVLRFYTLRPIFRFYPSFTLTAFRILFKASLLSRKHHSFVSHNSLEYLRNLFIARELNEATGRKEITLYEEKGDLERGFRPAVLCVLFVTSGYRCGEKVYINGIDANFPPFSYMDQSNNPDGFDVKALHGLRKRWASK